MMNKGRKQVTLSDDGVLATDDAVRTRGSGNVLLRKDRPLPSPTNRLEAGLFESGGSTLDAIDIADDNDNMVDVDNIHRSSSTGGGWIVCDPDNESQISQLTVTVSPPPASTRRRKNSSKTKKKNKISNPNSNNKKKFKLLHVSEGEDGDKEGGMSAEAPDRRVRNTSTNASVTASSCNSRNKNIVQDAFRALQRSSRHLRTTATATATATTTATTTCKSPTVSKGEQTREQKPTVAVEVQGQKSPALKSESETRQHKVRPEVEEAHDDDTTSPAWPAAYPIRPPSATFRSLGETSLDIETALIVASENTTRFPSWRNAKAESKSSLSLGSSSSKQPQQVPEIHKKPLQRIRTKIKAMRQKLIRTSHHPVNTPLEEAGATKEQDHQEHHGEHVQQADPYNYDPFQLSTDPILEVKIHSEQQQRPIGLLQRSRSLRPSWKTLGRQHNKHECPLADASTRSPSPSSKDTEPTSPHRLERIGAASNTSHHLGLHKPRSFHSLNSSPCHNNQEQHASKFIQSMQEKQRRQKQQEQQKAVFKEKVVEEHSSLPTTPALLSLFPPRSSTPKRSVSLAPMGKSPSSGNKQKQKQHCKEYQRAASLTSEAMQAAMDGCASPLSSTSTRKSSSSPSNSQKLKQALSLNQERSPTLTVASRKSSSGRRSKSPKARLSDSLKATATATATATGIRRNGQHCKSPSKSPKLAKRSVSLTPTTNSGVQSPDLSRQLKSPTKKNHRTQSLRAAEGEPTHSKRKTSRRSKSPKGARRASSLTPMTSIHKADCRNTKREDPPPCLHGEGKLPVAEQVKPFRRSASWTPAKRQDPPALTYIDLPLSQHKTDIKKTTMADRDADVYVAKVYGSSPVKQPMPEDIVVEFCGDFNLKSSRTEINCKSIKKQKGKSTTDKKRNITVCRESGARYKQGRLNREPSSRGDKYVPPKPIFYTPQPKKSLLKGSRSIKKLPLEMEMDQISVSSAPTSTWNVMRDHMDYDESEKDDIVSPLVSMAFLKKLKRNEKNRNLRQKNMLDSLVLPFDSDHSSSSTTAKAATRDD